MQRIECNDPGEHTANLLDTGIFIKLARKAVEIEGRNNWHRQKPVEGERV
jgi:hypothetical protein